MILRVWDVTFTVAFCGLLHGTLNLQPFFFAGSQGPEWLGLVTTLSGLALIVAAVWLYRRWATVQRPADFRPVVIERREEPLMLAERLVR